MSKRWAIQGLAARYLRSYVDERGVSTLAPGCFSGSIRSGEEIAFLRDHAAGRRVGSTKGGLTFYDCADGLAFRMEDPPASVLNAIRSGERRSMSVGFSYGKVEKMRANGVEFNLVRQADLVEISLVRRPAISNTSASIVDLDEVGSLRHCAESGSLALRGAWAALANAADDLCAVAAKKLDEDAALIKDFVAYARASSRSASRGQRRANKRRAMPIVDLTFAEDAYAMQPGAWETYEFFAGDGAFANFINGYARRSAQ